MEDTDLNYAKLLQKQLDTESKGSSDDSLLALELQEEFNHEFNCENAAGLTYDTKKKRNDDGRSLVDPSWELVDPTPNIHSLFVAFNERFFWNQLLTVCVSWSKRMTTCAGICSYQGRGGLCSISLSEPLLKLRPRKDLVETLLHEMIHAFLFVTDNNRDRDGHGPEFHKHMFRINKEAGTNITVYHSFYDEVRLYQQHWWRCNGPCQNRKPYFGMVRRAMNRAPGPSDRWWAEHQQTCGGSFIKVKEPEKQKPVENKKSITSTTSNGDIRKYITSPTKSSNTNNSKKSPKKTKPVVSPNRDIRSYLINNISMPTNGNKKSIETISNKNEGGPAVISVFYSGNIHGFKGLGTSSNIRKNLKDTEFKKPFGGSLGIKSNNSNTVVVTSTQPMVSIETAPEKTTSFPGTGRILSSHENTSDYTKVREHWLKKYDTTNVGTKRQASDEANDVNKRKRQPSLIEITDDEELDFVVCPVCDKKIKMSLSNEHIDQCLSTKSHDNQMENVEETCGICNKKIPKSEYSDHFSNCFNSSFGDDNFDNLEECPICNVYFDNVKIEQHIVECIQKAEKYKDKTPISNMSQCMVCSEFVEADKFDVHQEQCLHKMLDGIEEKYNIQSTNEQITCLVCKKKLLKSELNSHLDDCMSGVFEEKTSQGTTKNDEKASCSNHGDNSEGRYNCPFCMDLYSELDMSGHLDECLKSTRENENKSILIDSFCSDDL